jgi:hypothetical protein
MLLCLSASAVLAIFIVSFSTPTTAAAAEARQDPRLPSTTNQAKVFHTRGDYVHISSTLPRAASGHGWWEKGTSDATDADVTVQLQINKNGSWVNVGELGRERMKPGGGSANRASARVACTSSVQHEWRSVVDVNLVGYPDSADKLITPARLLSCGV